MPESQLSSELVKQVLAMRISNWFNKIPNPKCLYIDPRILDVVNFVFDFKFSASIITGKIYAFKDDRDALDADPSLNVVFFLYPLTSHFQAMASMIQRTTLQKKYYLYVTPESDSLCEEVLHQLSVFDRLEITSINFDFIPYTNNLYSLELSNHCTQLRRKNCVIQSLLRLTHKIGKFGRIIGKGSRAYNYLQVFKGKVSQIPELESATENKAILIVLDREIDLVTPLLTGLTYQCLLDHFYPLNHNLTSIPGKLISKDSQTETFLLYNKLDTIYPQIAHQDINLLPELLKKKANELREQITREKEAAVQLEDLNRINNTLMVSYYMTLNHSTIVLHLLERMKETAFFNKLTMQIEMLKGELKAEHFLELQYLGLFYPPEELIKMCALHTQLSDDNYSYSKIEPAVVELLDNIGHLNLLLGLRHLTLAKYLKDGRNRVSWNEIAQKFQLFPEEEAQTSYTFVNTLYSPLIMRVIEHILKDDLNPELISLLSRNTPQSSIINREPIAGSQNKSMQLRMPVDRTYYLEGEPIGYENLDEIYVYILGPISYNQISCMVNLGQRIKRRIVLLGENILNGGGIIKHYMSVQ